MILAQDSISSAGKMVEWIKYSAYGTPTGDTDSDGDFDLTDLGNMGGGYEIRKDAELDGDVDANDINYAIANGYQTLGRGVLSSSFVGNRKGYAGYENNGAIIRFAHVRNRVLDSTLGRWTRRDPIGYVDGSNLYEYTLSQPIISLDPFGLTVGWCEGNKIYTSWNPAGTPGTCEDDDQTVVWGITRRWGPVTTPSTPRPTRKRYHDYPGWWTGENWNQNCADWAIAELTRRSVDVNDGWCGGVASQMLAQCCMQRRTEPECISEAIHFLQRCHVPDTPYPSNACRSDCLLCLAGAAAAGFGCVVNPPVCLAGLVIWCTWNFCNLPPVCQRCFECLFHNSPF